MEVVGKMPDGSRVLALASTGGYCQKTLVSPRTVILPLLRPPLAALSVLMTTWIYNEFFWAIVMIKSDDKRPITSALGRLQGEYVTDFNLLAAGAIMAALPTLIIFFILKRQFVSGLTLGSTKG